MELNSGLVTDSRKGAQRETPNIFSWIGKSCFINRAFLVKAIFWGSEMPSKLVFWGLKFCLKENPFAKVRLPRQGFWRVFYKNLWQ